MGSMDESAGSYGWLSEISTTSTIESASRYQIGSDEVGVGDYFGPVVVCAAIVDATKHEELWKLGVKDSKLLNDRKMIAIAPKLKKLVDFRIAEVLPSRYNELTEKNFNAHHIKTLLHNNAIKSLYQEHSDKKPLVVIDQFCTREQYEKYSRDLNQEMPKIDIFQTKAESDYLAVAVASILARVHFVEAIEAVSKFLKIKIPLGSSNVIDIARNIYEKVGEEKMHNLVKWNFRTTVEMLKK